VTTDATMTLADQWSEWHTRGELRFQRCGACLTWIHLPRLLCPECGSEELTWEPSAGVGTIYSWTRTHRAFNPDFAAELPYVCALVDLAEGVRVLTLLVDAPAGDLAIGAPVNVAFETLGDTARATAVFRLADSHSGG
jgi:uncharacterized OB-fold protein